MSRMGISTIVGYQGAQLFEAVGISKEVVDEYFTGTVSRIGGLTLDQIEEEYLERYKAAFGEKANKNCDIKKTEKLLQYFLSVKDFSKLNQERNIDDALRTFKLALYIAQIIAEPYYVRAGLSLKAVFKI